jgi:hypothetical protein
MFLRSLPDKTIADIRDELDNPGEALSVLSSEINVDLMADTPVFRIREREVPATADGFDALALRFGVPQTFSRKLWEDPDLAQHLLNGLMGRQPKANVVMVHPDKGITQVRSQVNRYIEPRRLVDAVSHVLTPEAQVVDFHMGNDLRLDAIVPAGLDRGWGGDPSVNDLTGAGLRVVQNLRQAEQFYAPSVSLLLHRLVCTNGMILDHEEDRIDARGSTVDEVLRDFEELAQRVMGRAEHELETFYALREIRVVNPAGWLTRTAAEHDLPDRVVVQMINHLPEFIDENGTVSEFDLVNMITNQANNPSLRRQGTRTALQAAGGSLVSTSHVRCDRCQSLLD